MMLFSSVQQLTPEFSLQLKIPNVWNTFPSAENHV